MTTKTKPNAEPRDADIKARAAANERDRKAREKAAQEFLENKQADEERAKEEREQRTADELKNQLRRGFDGTDEEFENALPGMRERVLADRAIARTEFARSRSAHTTRRRF
jgi:signal recognition particle GTPase